MLTMDICRAKRRSSSSVSSMAVLGAVAAAGADFRWAGAGVSGSAAPPSTCVSGAGIILTAKLHQCVRHTLHSARLATPDSAQKPQKGSMLRSKDEYGMTLGVYMRTQRCCTVTKSPKMTYLH